MVDWFQEGEMASGLSLAWRLLSGFSLQSQRKGKLWFSFVQGEGRVLCCQGEKSRGRGGIFVLWFSFGPRRKEGWLAAECERVRFRVFFIFSFTP